MSNNYHDTISIQLNPFGNLTESILVALMSMMEKEGFSGIRFLCHPKRMRDLDSNLMMRDCNSFDMYDRPLVRTRIYTEGRLNGLFAVEFDPIDDMPDDEIWVQGYHIAPHYKKMEDLLKERTSQGPKYATGFIRCILNR